VSKFSAENSDVFKVHLLIGKARFAATKRRGAAAIAAPRLSH